MITLRPGETVNTADPVVAVPRELPAGRYLATLVVRDALLESEPVRLLIEIRERAEPAPP